MARDIDPNNPELHREIIGLLLIAGRCEAVITPTDWRCVDQG